jgi:hypothetical protein
MAHALWGNMVAKTFALLTFATILLAVGIAFDMRPDTKLSAPAEVSISHQEIDCGA